MGNTSMARGQVGPRTDHRRRTEEEGVLAARENVAPSARNPVRLAHPRSTRETAEDIPLEDGDVPDVFRGPGTVAETGAGRMPVLLTCRASGRPAPLQMSRRDGAWKFGIAETFRRRRE